MHAKTLMVQGTASSVGKSVLVTALCRILRQDGWRVAPFKSQNMSLNSFATPDGGEIGRAQAVQAEAAMIEPAVAMNPVLIKPEADQRAQVVVKGKPLAACTPAGYYDLKDRLWPVIVEALESLAADYEAILIEGAGSPAEVNLKDRDLVNMRVALHCRAPVLLAADIDRGGVFASLVGTLELLEPAERELVRGFVINKFRGDLSLLQPGLQWLERRTGIPVVGVVPYDHDIRIAEEDSLSLERRRALKAREDYLIDIAVIGFPHIANFDDFDPLEREEGVRLRYVESGDRLGAPDLVVLPGTKSTMADLAHLRETALAREVVSAARAGRPVIGICGGYQMLGELILDAEGVEGGAARAAGLGLLPVTTTFVREKSTDQVRGRVLGGAGVLSGAEGLTFSGYEIHMGQSRGGGAAAFEIEERSRRGCREPEGCLSPDGNVLGTYLHGLFHNERLRRAILGWLAARKGSAFSPSAKGLSREEEYDRLAAWFRRSLDMELVYRIMGLQSRPR